jgi:HK97 family phage major capsid protein
VNVTKELDAKQLESVISDAVGKKLADFAIDQKREADERFAKFVADNKLDVGRMLREEMAKGTGAQGDRERGVVTFDPHKGKGLDFARMVRCIGEAKRSGKSPVAVAEEYGKAGIEGYSELARGLTEGNFGSMGFKVPVQVSNEFIGLLYPQTVCLELGARTMEFKGSLIIGKQNQGATVYYVGEAQNITPSTPSGGTLEFKRKTAAAIVPIANTLLRNPSVGADTFLRDDLLQAIANKRDLSMLRGPGTEYQPRGLKNAIASANINGIAGATLANKVADLIGMIALVDGADVPLTRGGFAMNPRTKWALAATLDGNGNYVFLPMLAMGNLYGFAYKTSTAIPKNLGGGSNESEVYFGQWPELLLGIETDLEIEMFPNGTFFDGSALVSGISSDQSVIRALEGHDVLLRRNNAFSMLTGVTY